MRLADENEDATLLIVAAADGDRAAAHRLLPLWCKSDISRG
jgi:hypothetical protein